MIENPTSAKNWLDPSSNREPAFWVSEIRILANLTADKDDEIRRIPLQKGLNVVWSEAGDPKGERRQRGRGHAAGKTSFCRTLRYLLGEEHYGNPFIEERIQQSRKLLPGFLYGSVWIGEFQWAVFKPLNKHKTSQRFAVRDADFEIGIATAPSERLDYETEFLAAMHAAVVDQLPVRHYDHAKEDPIRWLDALMPLSRDQEAHLSSIHNWRSSSAGATSQKFTPSVRAYLMRSLLGIANPDEAEQLQIRNSQSGIINRAESTISTYRQVFEDEMASLSDSIDTSDVGGPDDALFVSSVQSQATKEADKRRREIQRKIEAIGITELRNRVESLVAERARIEGSIAEPREFLNAKREQLKAHQSGKVADVESEKELCERLFRNVKVGGDHCRVPVKQAVQECQVYWRCQIRERLDEEPSRVTADFSAQQSRVLGAEIRELEADLSPSERRIAKLEAELRILRNTVEANQQRKRALEEELRTVNEDFQEQVQSARNIQQALIKRAAARLEIAAADELTKTAEKRLDELRALDSQRQSELSEIFNAVIRELVSDDLEGALVFSRIETTATLYRDGELESEAYKALRCLAYDYTGLIARLHGIGFHPGFLLHDSPRESDLERSLYEQLFHFTKAIEDRAPNSFQYIITTTEAPPEELQSSHVRLRLDGSEECERFYRVNL